MIIDNIFYFQVKVIVVIFSHCTSITFYFGFGLADSFKCNTILYVFFCPQFAEARKKYRLYK